MSANRWLVTGNYFTSYREEQRIFSTALDRTIFTAFLLCLFIWPLFVKLSSRNMLVIDTILIAIVLDLFWLPALLIKADRWIMPAINPSGAREASR
jgi:hypothetical protein